MFPYRTAFCTAFLLEWETMDSPGRTVGELIDRVMAAAPDSRACADILGSMGIAVDRERLVVLVADAHPGIAWILAATDLGKDADPKDVLRAILGSAAFPFATDAVECDATIIPYSTILAVRKPPC